MHHYTCIIQNNLTDLCTHINNNTSHACKFKVRPRGNVTYHGNAMSHGNSTTRLVEIIFPQQILAFYTRNIVCCHACRNKIIIQQYHILMTLLAHEMQ